MIKLLIFGDIGHYDKELFDIIQISKSKICQQYKIILLGDNFYPYGVLNIEDQQWKTYEKFFDGFNKSHIHSILGNHDYMKNPICQIQNNYWNTPDSFYKINLTNDIDLYFLDTVILHPGHCGITRELIQNIYRKNINVLINAQISWFLTELEKDKNKRKIVFGHYPLISNGVYSSMMQPISNILLPIFKKYNVDAYIAGHEHNVQYLTRKYDNYIFRQFINGSSSQNRTHEFINKEAFYKNKDMYDNANNYMIELIAENKIIKINFVSKDNEIKYSYNI